MIASLMTDSAPPTIAASQEPLTIRPAPTLIADAPDEQVDDIIDSPHRCP